MEERTASAIMYEIHLLEKRIRELEEELRETKKYE